MGDDGVATDVALEMATRLSSSVALRLVLGVVTTPVHELDVVIEGSVAHALSSRGLRLLLLPGLGGESLPVARCESGETVAISMAIRQGGHLMLFRNSFRVSLSFSFLLLPA